MKNITMQDIALKAGKSRKVVSDILNNKNSIQISEETRVKVRRIARELNYRPNQFAQSLKTGRTHCLGISYVSSIPGISFLSRFKQPYLSIIYSGIGQAASKENYHLLFPEVRDEDDSILLAQQRMVDGLILIAPYLSPDQGNLRGEGWNALLRAHPVQALRARAGLVHWRVWHANWPRSMLDVDPLLGQAFSIADMREAEPQDLDAACAAMTVPLLVVQGADDPLFRADETPELVLRCAAQDRWLETVPDAGFLTVIPGAANPVAHWLEGR